MGVYEFAGIKHNLVEYLLLALFVSTGTFLIIRFFFIRFVEKKINPILKSLQSYTMSPRKLRETIDTGDVLGDLNKEVKVWADQQVEEIKKLKEMERYRKDFLGNVSHELKTPIFNIQGYLLTLLDGGMEDDTVNRLYLKRAEKSLNRLNSIVEDLDSIARLESGEFKMHIESFNLLKMVEEVIDDYEMPVRQRNIKVSLVGIPGKTTMVQADRKRIIEVLGNLVNNSIKYGKQGGKTTISLSDTGDNIQVDISDNGIGIEEKDLPRIFERFFRVDKSRSRESGGTGLGLSIVKHIIQAHHQTITVRSKVDKGTSFIFSLDKA
jgi:two-component system, OmpR family, phosphate regulon sensor histidine kinase PhoR